MKMEDLELYQAIEILNNENDYNYIFTDYFDFIEYCNVEFDSTESLFERLIFKFDNETLYNLKDFSKGYIEYIHLNGINTTLTVPAKDKIIEYAWDVVKDDENRLERLENGEVI